MNTTLIKYTNLLLTANENPVPVWVSDSFPIIKLVLAILIAICAIAMIVIVMCQKGETNGSASITGTTDTFYNRNKGTSLQGKLKKLAIIDAILLLVFCIIFLVLNAIYEGFIV